MFYLNSKNVGRTQDTGAKPKGLLVLDNKSWETMLEECEKSKGVNPNWKRDYAIIFIGCALGLRRVEVCALEKNNFRNLESLMVIHAPTAKQSEKIQFRCQHCGRRCRVKASSAGKDHHCAKCHEVGKVNTPKRELETGITERDLDIVEEPTIAFIQEYLSEMRADQKWLFEGRRGKPVSVGHVNRIFNTYGQLAGVDPRVSFHSLRHNRGTKLWSMFKDLMLVKKLLRHNDIKSAQVYADLDEEQRENVRQQLAKKAFDPRKKRKEN